MTVNVVKKWKKKTYINADILYEDVFYARTPDLERSFPPTVNATYTVVHHNETRSTLEELPIEDEKSKTKTPEENNNEETTKTDTTVVINKPPEV